MSNFHIPSSDGLDAGALGALSGSTIEIRLLHAAGDMDHVQQVFKQVWGSSTDVIPLELLIAIAHAGGYVVGAFDTGRGPTGDILGASVGLLATHAGRPALHSHVTGILPGARSTGLGRALKLHQQAWARARGIEWIVWTFDPLVRHNAWFNIAVLGADVDEYLPQFYGEMSDAINAGDDSDRLLVAWATSHHPDAPVRDGAGAVNPLLIPTPQDIVALRRTHPAQVVQWRTDTRVALTAALDAGRRIVGFTRDGDYVVEQ